MGTHRRAPLAPVRIAQTVDISLQLTLTKGFTAVRTSGGFKQVKLASSQGGLCCAILKERRKNAIKDYGGD